MKRSDIDQMFLDEVVNSRYPVAEVDQGPEAIPVEFQQTNGVSPGEFVRGALDTAAVGAKGMVQGSVGLPGDLEGLLRMVGKVVGIPVDEKTTLPTTEDVRAFFDKYVPISPEQTPTMGEGERKAVEQMAEIVPPAGPIAGAKQGANLVKGVFEATKDLPVGMSTKAVGTPIEKIIKPPADAPNVVSTRLPTAKKATEDPLTGELLSDIGSMKRDPTAFEKNVGLIKDYPNFTSKASNVDQQAEDFVQQVKDNLLYLYDKVPEATRNRSRLWYDGARNIVDKWGQEYKQPDQALAGVLAVLSPQKDWFMNVSLGNRVIDIALNQRGFKWDSAMDDMAKQIWKDPKYDQVLALVRGKRYEDLQSPAEKALWLRTYDQAFNPRDHRIVMPEGNFGDVRLTKKGQPSKVAWGSLNEIGKAVSILENPTLENISSMLGNQHKVRNFYNNIYAPGDPRGHVTIDTHAVAAGLLRPLSGNSKEVLHNFGSGIKGERGPANSSVSGSQGTYGIYSEAYKRAAQERGVLPREMQSITWEAVRGLFPDTFKTAKNAKLIDNIWLQYKNGKISLDEARDAVIRSAGGIDQPEWERGLRGGTAAEGGAPVDQGKLSGAGVPGRGPSGTGRNKPAAGNTSTVKRGQAPAIGAK